MATRRTLFGCALCAVTLGLSQTAAQAQTSGITRTILQTTDLPGGTHVVVLATAEIAPNVEVARHTHPGIESSYMVEGECTIQVAGEADRSVKAGDSFQIPPNAVHGVKNGPRPSRFAITFTVEKGKPLASPA